jgi:hypothetical protein
MLPNTIGVMIVPTTIGTVLGPLVGQVGVLRQTVERQFEEIAGLREERGRHAAELERAASTIVALGEEVERLRGPSERPVASNLTPDPSDPTPGGPPELFSGSTWMYRAATLLAIAAVVVLLLVLR